jgi:hypothetical protein
MACDDCDRMNSELKVRDRDHAMAAWAFSTVSEANEAVVFQEFLARLSVARLEHELARLTLEKHQRDGHAG